MARSPFSTRARRALARLVALLSVCTAILATVPSGAAARNPLAWEPSASRFWSVNHAAVMALFQNGECTQWAADKRPYVVQRIIVGLIANHLASGGTEVLPNMDAEYWTSDAQQVGIPTGHTPRVGALMVFQPGTLGAGPYGHIAYVEHVRKRTFTISEMHAPVLGKVTYQTLRKKMVAHQSGVSFVY